ncbi:hypothetical protein L837_0155 [Mycobacterium avium MAV_061107_1842]|nr:hypothetical protein L837_0155 [Mycobacterium avium MAV_061107_1842]
MGLPCLIGRPSHRARVSSGRPSLAGRGSHRAPVSRRARAVTTRR